MGCFLVRETKTREYITEKTDSCHVQEDIRPPQAQALTKYDEASDSENKKQKLGNQRTRKSRRLLHQKEERNPKWKLKPPLPSRICKEFTEG